MSTQENLVVEKSEQPKTKYVKIEWGTNANENYEVVILEVPINWDLKKLLGEWADQTKVNSSRLGFGDNERYGFIEWLEKMGAKKDPLEILHLGSNI